MSEPTTRKGG